MPIWSLQSDTRENVSALVLVPFLLMMVIMVSFAQTTTLQCSLRKLIWMILELHHIISSLLTHFSI